MSLRMTTMAVLGALLAAGCGKGAKGPAGGDVPAVVPTVEVATAAEGEIERRVEVTGTLAPWEEGLVAFQVDGPVTDLSADLGDRVKKDQVLARVDPREFQIRREQAEAEVAAAEADFGRVTGLAAKDMATKQQADEARRRLDVARAAADLARKKLADSVVRAPFAGVVARRAVNAGEWARTGNPAFLVVAAEPLKLRADVPERNAADVQVGDAVAVTSESFAGALSGAVHRIGPSVAVDSRSFPVEARVDNPGCAVKPGTFARASILLAGTRRGVLVPDTALVQFAGNPRVYVVADGKARERVVELGPRSGGRVLVTKGVAAGEAVVVTGASVLSDGMPVAVR